MKTFKYEIVLTDIDLSGDEFWEDCTKFDKSGITELTRSIEDLIATHYFPGGIENIKDKVKLRKYTDV